MDNAISFTLQRLIERTARDLSISCDEVIAMALSEFLGVVDSGIDNKEE